MDIYRHDSVMFSTAELMRWRTKMNYKTAGHTLSLGDMKAVLAQTVGKAKTEEMLNEAGINGAGCLPH